MSTREMARLVAENEHLGEQHDADLKTIADLKAEVERLKDAHATATTRRQNAEHERDEARAALAEAYRDRDEARVAVANALWAADESERARLALVEALHDVSEAWRLTLPDDSMPRSVAKAYVALAATPNELAAKFVSIERVGQVMLERCDDHNREDLKWILAKLREVPTCKVCKGTHRVRADDVCEDCLAGVPT